jgi:hypothetical protein
MANDLPRCAQCGRQNVPLYRANRKGVPAVWACLEHAPPPDPEVFRLVQAIAATTKEQ